MKSVNLKSKDKTPLPPTGWYRLSFFFKTTEACNQMAMPIAATLRPHVEALYFARYTSAVEARLDVVVKHPVLLNQCDLDRIIAKVGKIRWERIDGPVPCEGSPAHAAAFDFALKFTTHTLTADHQTKMALWCDVLHWMHNMAAYDYCDEAKCHLYSLDKIVNVFDNSIKLGNQMTKAARKLRRAKRSNPRNN